MKLAFSTVGCPDFSWAEITSMAKDLGFEGIELRGQGCEPAPAIPAFREEKRARTVKSLAEMRLAVSCVSAGCCLKDVSDTERTLRELREYIGFAQQVGAPFVRVLADRGPEAEGEVDDAAVAKTLRELVPAAEACGVTLLVESNGVYADTARLAALLSAVASDSVAALWDMHHPYRFAGETPEQTVQNLGAYIRYVHLKDSVMENGRVSYRMMGEGDLPVEEMIRALRSVNYEGYVCLEWLKRWMPGLSDAGVVFPQFADYMSRFFEDAPRGRRLYDNAAHTGQYIWEKETLIDLTFPQLLDRVVEEFPDQYAFRYTTLDYTRTYAQFRDDVDAFACALIAVGVRPGDHVAVWATNVPEWYLTFWAATKIGAVLVTVNTAYKIHEAEYLLRQSDTHTLVMIEGYKDSDYAAVIRELCPELATCEPCEPLHAKKLPFLRNVITVGFEMSGCLTWDQALERGAAGPRAAVARRGYGLRQSDVCNMQYTSGTTGFPKGVMLTHYNVVNNGKNIGDCMDLSTADRMMIQVPMFHCFGMVLAMTACVTHGVTMSPMPAFSPRLSLECINREKITCFHGVPTMFIAMLEHENFAQTDFSHMRTGIMAGSPCPIKVMKDVVEKMHMTQISIVYGQTEASPGCTQSRVDDPLEWRVNTVGHALPGVECRIVDPETGEELPDGQDGEFVARGYNIMKGYYKMPAATAAAIDAQGFLHTGDLARRDENGNFRITGRIKDMIIRGGENIYPKEIEEFIYTHPEVKDVQVIGVPDKVYGEEIMACVVPKEGAHLTEEELKEYVRSHMAKHKVPRYVAFVREFPMNAAGKILKYKMREWAVEKLGLASDSRTETA